MPVSDAVNAVLDGKLTPAKAVELYALQRDRSRSGRFPAKGRNASSGP
jgi:hypothetical protein